MATIKEVADHAGVSVGTVSHVVTGSIHVSEVLKKRVEDAILALDYHPNHVARSLKTSRTHTLGIIVPDMTISLYPQIIRGAETAARGKSYSLIAVNSMESPERQADLLSLLRSQQMEGILLVVTESGPGAQLRLDRLLTSGIPVVCLDRVPELTNVDSVSVEDVAAAEMGTDHLLAMGYKRIAIVTGPLTLRNERRRLQGYEQSLRRAGLVPSEALVWQGNLRPEYVAPLCRDRLSDSATRPDALLCTNGPTALGALRGMHQCGLRTPDDLGFVTFDELAVDDIFTPALTTIVQPAFEIGFQAAEILLDRIQHKATRPAASTLLLPATLKVRESSRHSQRARAKSVIELRATS